MYLIYYKLKRKKRRNYKIINYIYIKIICIVKNEV